MHILLIEWSYRVIPRHLDMSKIWKQFDNLFDMMPPIGARCSVDNLCDHRIFFIGHISKFACIEIQWKKMKKVSVLKINSSALAVDMKNPKLIKRLFQIPCSTAVPSGRSRIDQTTERFTQDSPWRNLPSRWFESSKSTTAVGCWFGVFLKTADFIAETHLLPSDRSNWDDVSPSLQTYCLPDFWSNIQNSQAYIGSEITSHPQKKPQAHDLKKWNGNLQFHPTPPLTEGLHDFNAKKSWMKPNKPRFIQAGWISMFDLGVAIGIDVYTVILWHFYLQVAPT